MGKNNTVQSQLIAIAGPTGSGKTLLAHRLSKSLGSKQCTVISQDDYYKDWSNLPQGERKKINFDDRKNFDFDLLTKHVKVLQQGQSVKSPSYSFITSKRLIGRAIVHPKPIVIIEGLMPWVSKKLCKFFDARIYVQADNAVCLARRLKRDINKRGDTVETVCKRYFLDVLPMQRKHVEPQKKTADLVIDGNCSFDSKVMSRMKKCILKNTKI